MRVDADKNYYKVLGVHRDATPEQIKSAYRRLARKFHPDLNPRRRSAETRFKEIQEAYDALSQLRPQVQFEQPIEFPHYFELTDEFLDDRRWFDIDWNWRRRLALILWGVCAVGVFLPNSVMNEFPAGGLIFITIPLVLIWVGDWLSEDETMDIYLGSIVTEIAGKVMAVIGWLFFARLVGLTFIGPLLLGIG